MPEKPVDGRNVWLPAWMLVGGFVGIVTLSVLVGGWIARTGDRAASTETLAQQVSSLRDDVNSANAKLDVMIGIQQIVIENGSALKRLDQRMDDQAEELNMMDAWIQRAIMTMREAGVEPPPYKPRKGGG